MSALPPKADMDQRGRDVCFVPIAEVGSKTLRAGLSFSHYGQTVQTRRAAS